MTGRTAFAFSMAGLLVAATLGLAPFADGPPRARAACGGEVGDPQALFSFEPAQSADFQVSGAAPLTVSATFLLDVLTPKGSTAVLHWGDGSRPTPFTAQDCGDDTINWPVQTHRHTYAIPGQYMIEWSFSVIITSLKVPVALVIAQQAQAPTPTTAPTQAPTATPPPAAPTATPAATSTQPPATATPASPTTLPAQGVTPVTSSPTPTPRGTSTAAAPATAVASGVLLPTSGASPSPAPAADREPDLPAVLSEMPRIDEISTDPGVAATNIALAGFTLWVLFSSVLLNQVLQDNRAEIDAKTGRLTRPLRRLAKRTGGSRGGRGALITAGVVLVMTGLIYGFLSPDLGLNRASLLLCMSAILGVGIVTYVCSGLEAAVTRRSHGLRASVRPYPASIAVAIASVALSRLTHIQPGVVYGFVASAAITGPGEVERRKQGAIAIFPVVAALALSVVALAIVEPIRANNGAASSFAGQLAIGAGIIIFIGGIEGVVFNMIPIAMTDGGKLFAWRKPVWAATAIVAAFLAWHVLLNRDRQSFDALRQASSVSILVTFAFYSAISVGLWAFFRRRAGGSAASPDPGNS